MLTVQWPSSIATHVEVWRVLDLSGLTKTVRESNNAVRAGIVFVDGAIVSKTTRIPVGKIVTIEIRSTNPNTRKAQVKVVNKNFRNRARSNTPTTEYRKP